MSCARFVQQHVCAYSVLAEAGLAWLLLTGVILGKATAACSSHLTVLQGHVPQNALCRIVSRQIVFADTELEGLYALMFMFTTPTSGSWLRHIDAHDVIALLLTGTGSRT